MAIDYKAIAEFAIDNPEMWEILSAGYDDDATDAISDAITEVEKTRGFAKVTKALGVEEFSTGVETFDATLRVTVENLLNIAPLQERVYKGTARNESRVTLNNYFDGLNVDLRVWERVESDEEDETSGD